jgi:hypothetical protein
MFAGTKQAAVVGAILVALGWVSVVSPGVAYPQPPRPPEGNNFSCPDIAGINFVRDPEDVHEYYLCVDGLLSHHYRCPQLTVLVMGFPPKCVPFPHGMP